MWFYAPNDDRNAQNLSATISFYALHQGGRLYFRDVRQRRKSARKQASLNGLD